jgi:hypothetical protein
MIERVCPRCHAGNGPDHTRCDQCGAAFDQPLARQTPQPLAQRPIALPVQWKQAGKVVALGMAAVAAEVGLALLQRHGQRGTQLAVRQPRQVSGGRVIAVGRRVSETWRGGELQQRVEEQVMWMVPGDRD